METLTEIIQERAKNLPPALASKTTLLPLLQDLAAKAGRSKIILYENFYSRADDAQGVALLALKEGTPVKALIQVMGLLPITAVIGAMIDGYCQQFNVSKNMTARQIEDLAIDLATMFNNRKGNSVMLEELAIFFDRLGKGDFVDASGKKLIPFDRIDRGLIEAAMDIYFETDRTQAVWKMEDEKRIKMQEVPPAEDFRLSNEGGITEPQPIGDIYTDLAGKPGAIPLAKMLNELNEKYGNEG